MSLRVSFVGDMFYVFHVSGTLDLKNDAKKLLEGNGIMDFKVDA